MITILIFLSLFTFTSCFSCSGNITIEEYTALNAFFVDAHGEFWVWNTSYATLTHWIFTSPQQLDAPCTNHWQGITCNTTNVPGNCEIISISLQDMNLSGTLSPEIANLPSLSILDVSYNLIQGNIPSRLSFGYVDVSNNAFVGSIPDFTESCGTVQLLNFSSNHLTGTIPESIQNCTQLSVLDIAFNKLHGTVPNVFHGINLTYFFAGNNQFSGPIDHVLANVSSSLEFFSMDNNQLTGHIHRLADLHKIIYFDVGHNSIDGTLPDDIAYPSTLMNLILDHNKIDGSFPTGLASLPNLIQMDAESNLLRFPLPTNWNCFNLTTLNLYQNSISGSLPSSIGTLTRMQTLLLGYNQLTSTIPTTFQQLTNLVYFNISNNNISGSLDNIFGAASGSSFPYLSFIDAAQNILTGTIPSVIWQFPNIQYVLLFSNCFSEFPQGNDICSATRLQVLSLSYLSQAYKCVKRINFNPWGQAYLGGEVADKLLLRGKMPSCLWSFSEINTIRLAGNAIIGTIPDLPSYVSLTNMDISYNYLSGTLPVSLQSRGLGTFIANSNKITGVLSSNFAVANENTTLVYLSHNRISGAVPNSLLYINQIDILQNNLFDCNQNPINDDKTSEFSCGSSILDSAYYTWGTVFFGTLFFAIVIHYYLQSYQVYFSPVSVLRVEDLLSSMDPHSYKYRMLLKVKQTLQWYYFDYSSTIIELHNTQQFLRILWLAGWGSMRMAGFYLVFCITMYICFKAGSHQQYSTYQYQYGWTITSANLQGPAPTVLILLVVFGSFVYMFSQLSELGYQERMAKQQREQKKITPTNSQMSMGTSTNRSSMITGASRASTAASPTSRSSVIASSGNSRHSMFAPIDNSHRSTSVSARVSFFISTPEAANPDKISNIIWTQRWICFKRCCHILLIQAGNALVTFIVNIIYVYLLIHGPTGRPPLSFVEIQVMQLCMSLFKVGWNASYIPFALDNMSYLEASYLLMNQVFMYIINFIIGPTIAVLVADTQCFYYILMQNSVIESTFAYSAPFSHYFVSSVYPDLTSGSLTLTTPYLYLAPVTSTAIVSDNTVPAFMYSYQCGSAVLNDFVPVLLYTFTINAIVLPVMRFIMMHIRSEYWKRAVPSVLYTGFVVRFILEGDSTFSRRPTSEASSTTAEAFGTDNGIELQTQTANSAGSIKKKALTSSEKVFDPSIIVAKRLLDSAILMTFGIACPVLGLGIALCVLANTTLWKLLIGRFMTISGANNPVACERLEKTTSDISHGVVGSMWIVIISVGIFWCINVFDMIADEYTYLDGIGVICGVVVALPLITLATLAFMSRYHQKIKQVAIRMRDSMLVGRSSIVNTGRNSVLFTSRGSVVGNARGSMVGVGRNTLAGNPNNNTNRGSVFGRKSTVGRDSAIGRKSLVPRSTTVNQSNSGNDLNSDSDSTSRSTNNLGETLIDDEFADEADAGGEKSFVGLINDSQILEEGSEMTVINSMHYARGSVVGNNTNATQYAPSVDITALNRTSTLLNSAGSSVRSGAALESIGGPVPAAAVAPSTTTGSYLFGRMRSNTANSPSTSTSILSPLVQSLRRDSGNTKKADMSPMTDPHSFSSDFSNCRNESVDKDGQPIPVIRKTMSQIPFGGLLNSPSSQSSKYPPPTSPMHDESEASIHLPDKIRPKKSVLLSPEPLPPPPPVLDTMSPLPLLASDVREAGEKQVTRMTIVKPPGHSDGRYSEFVRPSMMVRQSMLVNPLFDDDDDDDELDRASAVERVMANVHGYDDSGLVPIGGVDEPSGRIQQSDECKQGDPSLDVSNINTNTDMDHT